LDIVGSVEISAKKTRPKTRFLWMLWDRYP
jgi:hypothetical protein